MNINLDYYKIFRSVVQQGSFSAAAKELFITQPAVSQAVSHLENQLQTKLFTRTKKGAFPTEEGRILFEHISAALQMISAGEEKLERMNNLQSGISGTVSRSLSRHQDQGDKPHEPSSHFPFKIRSRRSGFRKPAFSGQQCRNRRRTGSAGYLYRGQKLLPGQPPHPSRTGWTASYYAGGNFSVPPVCEPMV